MQGFLSNLYCSSKWLPPPITSESFVQFTALLVKQSASCLFYNILWNKQFSSISIHKFYIYQFVAVFLWWSLWIIQNLITICFQRNISLVIYFLWYLLIQLIHRLMVWSYSMIQGLILLPTFQQKVCFWKLLIFADFHAIGEKLLFLYKKIM